MNKDYLKIKDHYESCLEKHGNSIKSLDYPDEAENLIRYEVMLDLYQGDLWAGESRLWLDFGCGFGDFSKVLDNNSNDRYVGMDISPNFIKEARKKYPYLDFRLLDLLNINTNLEKDSFDYTICNGLFAVKKDLSSEYFKDYMTQLLHKLWDGTKSGLAFNIMDKHKVEWEREDLFFMPYDEIANLIVSEFTPHYTIRADYGLREFCCYLYK